MDTLTRRPLTLNPQNMAVVAGNGANFSSTGTVAFHILGKSYTHAALSNQAAPTSDIVTGATFERVGANEGCVFVIGFNAAGTVCVAQGPVKALTTVGAFTSAPLFPPVPDTVCPIAYYIVKADSTANAKATGFLMGTTNTSGGTGLTHTFVNIATLPDHPQIA